MRVWLCLLGLGVTSCLCDSDQSYVDNVIDLRTRYREFLPDILKEIPDPSDEPSREVNLTAVCNQYKEGADNINNWSKLDSLDDPGISQSKREWLRRMNPKKKNEYSWECNSSEYNKYHRSLERREWKEGNTTDLFEEDLSDLWDLYMANKTLAPDFPLAYSPPLMFQKYREYSLSYYNITIPTTQHWLLGPLTGDDGIQYDIAMERYKKYNISKNDPVKVAAANQYLETDMEGKKLNKTKDIIRYFIDLRRRLGATLKWTRPTISISKEVENMNPPDTREILDELDKEVVISKEMGSFDIEAHIKNYNSKEVHISGEQRVTTTQSTIQEIIRKQETTKLETPPPNTLFVYQFNPIPRAHVSTSAPEEKEDSRTRAVNPKLVVSVKTEKTPTSTEKVTSQKILTKTLEMSTRHEPTQSDRPATAQQYHLSSHHFSSKKYHTSSTQSGLEFQDKYKNNTAVKFLHKHKNKFLLGGMACLIAAKVFGS